MEHKTTFQGVVRLDEQGELVCFCYKKDVEAGLCKCVQNHDCPEAFVEISIIAGSRPSEQAGADLRKIAKKVEDTAEKVVDSAGKIKQGLSALEKAIKKNSHFRI